MTLVLLDVAALYIYVSYTCGLGIEYYVDINLNYIFTPRLHIVSAAN